MVRFLVLFLFLVSNISQAAYLPQGETLLTGGLTLVAPRSNANIKHFIMYAAANGGWSTFMEQNNFSNTRYQIPGGKSLRILSATMIAGNVAFSIRLGYGDNSVNGNSGSPPTNCRYVGGDGTCSGANAPPGGRAAASTVVTINPIGAVFPASKYPFIYWDENTATSTAAYATVYVIGIEE